MSKLPDDVRAAIAAQHDLMKQAFASGDADPIVDKYYTEDAWVFGDGDQTWKGSQAIHELYAGIVGKYTWTTKTEQIIPLGDGALEFLIGTIHPVDGSEPTVYKILFGWVKAGESWRCSTQMFAFGDHF
ncbi:YybH family protein [Rhizobium sp. YTU87027]|uniref:YybH family protein n=1 Tax=Rhizobium sp. YTU87027 TaxID=3417741 RepID=UPI003D681FA2